MTSLFNSTFDRRLVYVYESLKTWISTHDWYTEHTMSYLHTKIVTAINYIYIQKQNLWDIVGNNTHKTWWLKIDFQISCGTYTQFPLWYFSYHFIFDVLRARKSHRNEKKRQEKTKNSKGRHQNFSRQSWVKKMPQKKIIICSFLYILYSYLLHKLTIY